MIKFFRKIRQQLLAENKFSKYLVYAVGEIVLVVIGILIALQLNALKQEKEDRNYELILLKNIRHEIFSDILYHKSLYENAKARDLISQHLLNSYGTENDSLALALYPIISKGISFAYRKGAYEALKSTGLDKISNNSLRDHLTTMYDFGLPLISRSLDEIETNKTILVEKLEQELFAPAIIIDDQGNKNINLVPREGNLLNDDRLLSLIRTNQFKGKEFMKEVEKVFPNTELLLSQLNNELKGVYPILSIEEEKLNQ